MDLRGWVFGALPDDICNIKICLVKVLPRNEFDLGSNQYPPSVNSQIQNATLEVFWWTALIYCFFFLLWLTYGKASVYYEGYSLRASFSIVSAVKDVEAKFITKLSAVS
jgi:hypothetical protein